MGRNRAVVDDAPAARRLRFHDPKCLLDTQKHAGQVDVHHVAPVHQRDVFQGNTRRVDTRVIEKYVDPSPGGNGGREQGLHRLRIGYIGGDRQRTFGGATLFGDLFQGVDAATRQHHPVTVIQQRQRRGLANPGAGTGYNSDS